MNIRDASFSDCAELADIYHQSLAARDSSMEVETSSEVFEALLRAQCARECCLVIEVEGRILGYGLVKSYSPRIGYRVACETSIYLDRSRTGEGLGTRLQTALMERCREYRYHYVTARIWATNLGSIRFHERFGFGLVGIQKEIGYLGGQWRDVALLQRIFEDIEPYEADLA